MADFGGMSADQINSSMGFGSGGVGAQGQNQLNNIFGNFGQQTDYYSGLGAAYGRATGGFNGPDLGPMNPIYGGGGQSPAYDYGSLYGTGAAAVPPSSYGGSPRNDLAATMAGGGGYGFGSGLSPQDWATFSRAVGPEAAQKWLSDQMGQPQAQPSASFNDRFPTGGNYGPGYFDNTFGAANSMQQQQLNGPLAARNMDRYFNDATANQPFNPQPSGGGGQDLFAGMSQSDLATWTRAMQAAGRGSEIPSSLTGGSSPPSMNMPTNLGYNSSFGSNFTGGGSNDFQNRFGMGFPGAGTPSQYTGSPYTNTQGQTFQPNLPGGFAPQFDANTPGGALNPNQYQPWLNGS